MPIVAEPVIPSLFLPQLRALRRVIFDRVLPIFASIDSEAEQVERDSLSALLAAADEDADTADLYEAAHSDGLAHFELMVSIRQGLINALTIQVSHLFEQQRYFIARDTILDVEGDSRKLESRFRAKLDDRGVDDSMFIHRGKLLELDLVANAAKHAEGQSADKLRALRPELFTHPSIRDEIPPEEHGQIPITRPLMGEDLFVGEEDLRAYIDAVEAYWRFVLHSLAP